MVEDQKKKNSYHPSAGAPGTVLYGKTGPDCIPHVVFARNEFELQLLPKRRMPFNLLTNVGISVKC